MKTLSKVLIAAAQGVEQAVIIYETMVAQEQMAAQAPALPRAKIGFASGSASLKKDASHPFTEPPVVPTL